MWLTQSVSEDVRHDTVFPESFTHAHCCSLVSPLLAVETGIDEAGDVAVDDDVSLVEDRATCL